MNRSTRMLLMSGGKRKVGVEYEWEPEDHYGPYMPTTYDQPPMDPRSAFYDRRGRRHYDSGRYAPMSYSDGRLAPRSDYMPMEPWPGEGGYPRMEREGSPRMIGFSREWSRTDMASDATMPRIMEMDQIRGQQSQHGRAYSNRFPQFDQRMATEWTRGMVNADGTKGPHWTMEQTTDAMKKHGVSCDPLEFWVIMNSLYSDYCEALKKNNASTMETYVCLAKAWIEDDDAVPDKAAAYYTYVVEH